MLTPFGYLYNLAVSLNEPRANQESNCYNEFHRRICVLAPRAVLSGNLAVSDRGECGQSFRSEHRFRSLAQIGSGPKSPGG